MNNKQNENRNSEQDKVRNRLSKMIQKNGEVFWEALDSLTGFYQHFGFCECGRMPVALNVGKSHFMYCKKCNVYWNVGFNLFGQRWHSYSEWVDYVWRHEDESVWKKNDKILQNARPIESKHLYVSPRSHHAMLMTFEQMEQVAKSDWGGQEKTEHETPSSNQEHCFDNEIPF